MSDLTQGPDNFEQHTGRCGRFITCYKNEFGSLAESRVGSDTSSGLTNLNIHPVRGVFSKTAIVFPCHSHCHFLSFIHIIVFLILCHHSFQKIVYVTLLFSTFFFLILLLSLSFPFHPSFPLVVISLSLSFYFLLFILLFCFICPFIFFYLSFHFPLFVLSFCFIVLSFSFIVYSSLYFLGL